MMLRFLHCLRNSVLQLLTEDRDSFGPNGTRSIALRFEQGVLRDISSICHHLMMHLPSLWRM